jgi:hypothetical protein
MARETGGMGLLGFTLGGVVVVLAILVSVIYGGEGTGPKVVNLDLANSTGPGSR